MLVFDVTYCLILLCSQYLDLLFPNVLKTVIQICVYRVVKDNQPNNLGHEIAHYTPISTEYNGSSWHAYGFSDAYKECFVGSCIQ
jgi:hypothetical protein